jgi:D-glycero-alpha-D-manno-heptose 1-phosphate guanylyltransferase
MNTAIILAGGLGTRLRSVVSDVPKPMAPINGVPFLALLLDNLISNDVTHFVLSVGYQNEKIINYFGANYKGAKISYAVEETPLGTGGGLLLALDSLDQTDPVFLLNGDTHFDIETQRLLDFHNSQGSVVSFSLFRANEEDRFGSIRLTESGHISDIPEKKAQIGELANGGVYVLNPAALKGRFPSNKVLSFETDIINTLLNNGETLCGLEFNAPFLDIGVPKDYARASKIMLG